MNPPDLFGLCHLRGQLCSREAPLEITQAVAASDIPDSISGWGQRHLLPRRLLRVRKPPQKHPVNFHLCPIQELSWVKCPLGEEDRIVLAGFMD